AGGVVLGVYLRRRLLLRRGRRGAFMSGRGKLGGDPVDQGAQRVVRRLGLGRRVSLRGESGDLRLLSGDLLFLPFVAALPLRDDFPAEQRDAQDADDEE